MIWLALIPFALAGEITVQATAPDGLSASWSHEASEPVVKSFGPFVHKKEVVTYAITVPPTAYAVVQQGYPVKVTICRRWVKKSKKGEDCVTEPMIAGPSGQTAELEVKESSKWSMTLTVQAEAEVMPELEAPAAPE